jgi:proteic killer suppression protein
MEIIFQDKKMQELIMDKSKLVQKYGPQVAKQIHQRVAEILACDHLAILKQIPNGLHPLKLGRKGQFAVDLGPAYRLIFEPAKNPLPRRPDGTIVWERVDIVRILEITDYHDERI